MSEEEEAKFCPFLSAAMLIVRSKEGRCAARVVCDSRCALFICDGISADTLEDVGYCGLLREYGA